jgi:hypothetical protein
MTHVSGSRLLPRLAGAAALLVAAAAPAPAEQRTIIIQPAVPSLSMQLQAARNAQQAQQFQLQQRIDREQDRRDLMRRPPQPDVPVMKPTCAPGLDVPCR